MNRVGFSCLLIFVGSSCASNRARADDLLGFYVGAAIGESHLRTSQEILGDSGYDYKFDQTHTAWKATVGIRPISLLGAELNYTDFGTAHSDSETLGFGGLTREGARAWTVFGVGYLPLPVPFLDVYGKLGIARLHTTTTEVGPIPACPADDGPCGGSSSFNISQSTTNFAYGAGVQGKFGALAVRAEYERISAGGGNPDLVSLGVTWTF